MTAYIAQQHASSQLRQQQLKKQLDENQVDIYVLNAREVTDFWLTVQRQEGKTQVQAEALFQQLTGLTVVTAVGEFGRDYGAASNDVRVLTVLANDLKRGGRFFDTYRTTMQNGRQYIIFKGNHRARQVVKGTRYLASNTGLVKMAVGKEGLKQSAKSGFLVSVIFSLSLHSLQWLFEDEYRWTNWLAGISTDLVKIAIAGAAGYFAGLGAAALSAAIFGGTIVVVPIAAGIIATLFVGAALSYADEHFQITQRLIQYLTKKEEKAKHKIYDGLYYAIISTSQSVKRQLTQAARRKINDILRSNPLLWN
ncbi:hypothetical protein Q3O60_12885 [Alkalimonas collagenimarina]|uniref:Uncharacterized protein n=1 Tax=Alkalimonas collagenimarina TaxID=400390 RepID=A0ABT9H190_9GAMM|nr:hypothetical protein [Alkalimonas collagenimarina]MDP4537087.1 hypothetical protein [Alkalimonas collagenimarina]